MQPIGWSHINASIEQTVHKSRVLSRIRVLAIVAIIVDGIAPREINLEHRAKALDDCVDVVTPENIAQSGDSRIADCVNLLVDRGVIGREQVEIGRDYAHREPVAIEGSVVQHHVAAPAHAVKNLTGTGDGAHGKTRSQSLTERAEVGLEFVVLLASTLGVAESCDDFVKDEKRSMSMGQIADLLQITFAGQDAAHIGHDGLGDHRG